MDGEAAGKAKWAERLTRLALLLSVGGLAAALIAAIGSGQGVWSFRLGFAILRYVFFAAAAGGVMAIVAFILSKRSNARTGRLNLLALFVSLAFGGYLFSYVRTARSVPGIHDVTTNLADVPRFAVLKVRPDNLDDIPDEGRPGLAALDPESRWKAIHREGYGDLRTVRLPSAVPETVRQAAALARARGWDIARADPRAGVLEATDTSLFFRFKDDVVLRVRPSSRPAGGSVVDMRSISRVGGSDIGVNAKRIRAFLQDLQAGGLSR